MNKLPAGISMPFFNKPAVIAPHNASIEPTERSMPAVSTINVMPDGYANIYGNLPKHIYAIVGGKKCIGKHG